MQNANLKVDQQTFNTTKKGQNILKNREGKREATLSTYVYVLDQH